MKRKYDLVIYLSLFAAIVCLTWGLFDYSNSDSIVDNKSQTIREAEPIELEGINKGEIINAYLEEVSKKIGDDGFINANIVDSWDKWEVESIEFNRKITDDYYAYNVNIKVYGNKRIYPVTDNVKEYQEYTIIGLTANITKKNEEFMVKTMSK